MTTLFQTQLFFLSVSIITSSVACQLAEDTLMFDLYEILVGTPSPIQYPFGRALIRLSNRVYVNLVVLAYFMKNNVELVAEWAKHNPIYAMILVAWCVRMYTNYKAHTRADEGL